MKKLMFFVMGIFLLNFASAALFDISTWDDKVTFNDKGRFGAYEINDTTFWLFNNKPVKTIELIENDWGLWSAWNVQEIKIHKKSKLFDKTDFLDSTQKNSKIEFISSQKIEYRSLISTTTMKDNWSCTGTGKYNECNEWDNSPYSESQNNWSNWEIYSFQSLEAGTYQVRTTVTRNSLSSGVIEWVDTNEGHKLDKWAAWWNTSLSNRRAINGTNSNLLLPVNRSGHLSADSDVDDDGEAEVIYGISNDGYIYYNDDTDTYNANTTSDLCLFDTLNNRSQCANMPTSQVAYFPFDFNRTGIGSLANKITLAGSTASGTLSHPAGVINGSYDSSDVNGGEHYKITSDTDLDFGTGDFAIALWVKIGANCNGGCWVFTMGDYLWFNVDEALEFYDGSVEINDPTVFGNGQWNHVVLQRSGSNLTIWVNGTNTGVGTWSDDWPNADALLCYNGGGRGVVCDDLHIFKGRALTYAEIQELYTGSHATYLNSAEITNLNPTITPTSPANNTESFWHNQTFTGTAIDYDGSVTNVSIYIDNLINQTNTSGLNNTAYSFDIEVPYDRHTWIMEVCDDSAVCVNSSARVINITHWEINSVTYSATTTNLDLENYLLNISTNDTINEVIMNYAGYNLNMTDEGAGIWNTSFQLNDSLSGTNTFYFNISQTGNWSYSGNYSQTVSSFVFTLCNSTYNQTYLNITFKDETNLTKIPAKIPASTFTAVVVGSSESFTYIFSNNTANTEYDFCAFPTDKTVALTYQIQYEDTNYPQRINERTSTISNATTNETFYLLQSSEGQYVTFQVVNVAEQPLQNVNVSAYRSISGTDTLISFGQTAADGGITFWLDPDFQHTFFFNHSSYNSEILTNFPTQSSYTVTMGGGTTTDFDYTKGITIDIYPSNTSLFNSTDYNFNFTIETDYWLITEFGFTLQNSTGTVFNTTSASTDGGSLQVTKNTDESNTDLVLNYYYVVNATYQNFTRRWTVYDSSLTGYSITNFASNLNTHLDSGIFGATDVTKALLSFIFIFIATGLMSLQFGKVKSYATLMAFLFSLVLFLDVGIGLLPNVNGNHFITILMGILAVGVIIKEATK